MTIYAPGRHEELGRGGRYICGADEPATGLTLYPDAVLRAAPARAAKTRVYLAAGCAPAQAIALRAQGYATVAGLDPVPDPATEARRLDCSHLLTDRGLSAVAPSAVAME